MLIVTKQGVNIIYCKNIPELYHHCGSGIEAAQLFGGQVFKDSCLSKVVGIVGPSDGHLREKGESVCIHSDDRSFCPPQYVQH